MNFTYVTGRLGKDPELQATKTVKICKFPLGVLQGARGKESTSWFKVVVWGVLGEKAAKELKKGDSILVVGTMKQRFWKDNQGVNHESWELHAQMLSVMTPRNEPKPTAPSQPESEPEPEYGPDDIPF